jgi:uncharacterized protein YecT (DUF1311 family)
MWFDIQKAAICLGVMAVLAGAAQPGAAQQRTLEESFSPTYQKCMEASGGVTVAMLDCGAAEYRTLDAELNAAYRAASAILTPDQRNLLRNTQRAWLAHRDATCSFMTGLHDRGTMASLSDQSCLLKLTAERTKWLKDLSPL